MNLEKLYTEEYKTSTEEQVDSLCDAILCDLNADTLSRGIKIEDAKVDRYGSAFSMSDMIQARIFFSYSKEGDLPKTAVETLTRDAVKANLRIMCEELLFSSMEETEDSYRVIVAVELLSDFCDDAFFESCEEEN